MTGLVSISVDRSHRIVKVDRVRLEHTQAVLEVFRTEAETAAQFYLDVHACAGAENRVYRLLNTAPLFWNTILGGLQTAAFVVLGRIFDQDSPHNLGRLLRLAQDHPKIFSKDALARRKQGAEKTPPDWLDSYLKHVYVPKPADFRRLRGYVRKHRKIYLEKYQPLRHQVFAHKGLSDAADVSALFAKTNIREMQRMLVFLMSLYDALWGLFVNGQRPVLRPQRYSVKRMRERTAKNPRGGSVLERLVREAERFLKSASATLPARQ
jgi:AbiU2